MPIKGLWLNIQNMVGTPHKLLRCFRGRGGTPNILVKVIWSDVHTRVGTPHKVLEQNVKLYPGWLGGCRYRLRIPDGAECGIYIGRGTPHRNSINWLSELL